MLNFQGASLNDVLNYLSEAAGFVIVKEADISGTVNIVSRQPISADDAVDLLNTVLVEKGYVRRRADSGNGRVIRIELTKAGVRALERGDRAVDDVEHELLADLDPSEVTELREVLLRCGRALEHGAVNTALEVLEAKIVDIRPAPGGSRRS